MEVVLPNFVGDSGLTPLKRSSDWIFYKTERLLLRNISFVYAYNIFIFLRSTHVELKFSAHSELTVTFSDTSEFLLSTNCSYPKGEFEVLTHSLPLVVCFVDKAAELCELMPFRG